MPCATNGDNMSDDGMECYTCGWKVVTVLISSIQWPQSCIICREIVDENTCIAENIIISGVEQYKYYCYACCPFLDAYIKTQKLKCPTCVNGVLNYIPVTDLAILNKIMFEDSVSCSICELFLSIKAFKKYVRHPNS